jgi:DNA-binding Lrp family transcriptional regulator
MKQDDVQRDYQLIARYFLKHPEAPADRAAHELASAIGSSSTAERRIRKMKADAILSERTTIIDWEALGYPFQYRIDVHVDQEALHEPESGEKPHEPVDNWRRLVQYIMKELIPFLERIPAAKTISKKRFSKDDVILENVTMLMGQQADLTVTIRARTQDAVMTFVVDGLRGMRGVKTTSASHEAWSYSQGEL